MASWNSSWSRRRFLRSGAIAAVGLSLAPRTALGSSRPVVIVGAGLAGLATAYELDRAGVPVRLLESSHRPGGRVRTIRDRLADGVYSEAGAQTAGSAYDTFLGYVRQFGLGLTPVTGEAGVSRPERDVLLLIGGQRLKLSELRRDPALWPLELSDEERRVAPFGLIGYYLMPIARELGRPEQVLGSAFERYDGMSLHDLLLERGATSSALELIERPLNYNDSRTVSALSVLRDLARRLERQAGVEIVGGNDRLTTAFAAHLGSVIEYGARVRSIDRSGETEGGPIRLAVARFGGVESVEADRVVITLPFTTLRDIAVTPEWPSAREEAIRELPYTQVAKTMIQTRTRGWMEEGELTAVSTDGRFERFFDLSEPEKSSRGFLQCWVNGRGLDEYRSVSAEDQAQATAGYVEELFPKVRGQIEQAYTVNWYHEYSRGAYAHYAPGQVRKFAELIPQPEGRIHFAGEHTQLAEPGMEGALVSGVRAAREVLASRGGQSSDRGTG